MSIPTILSVKEMRQYSWRWKSNQLKVAFVPTMGALHEGHLTLVKKAKEVADRVVVSIFVNPLQFGPQEDFSRYPRTLKMDIEKLETVNADAVFSPTAAEIYPAGFHTTIVNREMSKNFCGEFRPGHFEGVLTVVAKLFMAVNPDTAFFGKKDFQQWRLIERMVRDLGFPLEVVGIPTFREDDGLAMSSRNRYLSAEQRTHACLIFQGLQQAKELWKSGERSKEKLIKAFVDRLLICKEMKIQYLEIADSVSLSKEESAVVQCEKPVMLAAVNYGDVRLIDNIEFED